MKNSKGITLIALIITIVVLLILAAVTIGALDKSKIIGQATDASTKYEEEKGKDEESLKDGEDLIKYYGKGENNSGGIDSAVLLAKFTENPEAYKHPEQSEANADRAIGTDGTAVNMDWWKYTKDDVNKEITLNNDTGSAPSASYVWKIENGSLVGAIPQYIKPNGSNEIYTVTSLDSAFIYNKDLKIAPAIPPTVTKIHSTFAYCTNLTTAPIIPNTITSMHSTFYDCENLTEAPEIPDTVTSMYSTFSGCTSLVTAPEIPNSVTDMSGTFAGCTSLVTAPEIPNSVTDMGVTFSGCTSLVTAPEIPNSVVNLTRTFMGCTSLTTVSKIPDSVTKMLGAFDGCINLTTAPDISKNVTDMSTTFNGCISLIAAPIIPSKVTDMWSTFKGCTSLEGTLRIESKNITNVLYLIENAKINKIQVPANSVTETKIRAAYPDITIETF